MAKVLGICPNWKLLMKAKNSTLDLMCLSVFILLVTFKCLSSALGCPPLLRALAQPRGRWKGGRLQAQCRSTEGTEGVQQAAAPGNWSDFYF